MQGTTADSAGGSKSWCVSTLRQRLYSPAYGTVGTQQPADFRAGRDVPSAADTYLVAGCAGKSPVLQQRANLGRSAVEGTEERLRLIGATAR